MIAKVSTSFVLLLAVIKCDVLSGFRERRRPRPDEMLAIMDRYRMAEEYSGTIVTVPGTVVSVSEKYRGPRTARDALDDVVGKIDGLEMWFADTAYGRVHGKLKSFYGKSIELIGRSAPDGGGGDYRRDVADYVKLEGQNLCAESFLFNAGAAMDVRFIAVMFLKTFSVAIERGVLLDRLRRMLSLLTETDDDDDDDDPAVDPTKTIDELRSELADIKNALRRLTETFCVPTIPPIVIDHDVEKTSINTTFDLFFKYTYEKEPFYVSFYPKSEPFTYYCSDVERSPEYGVEQYIKDVRVNEADRQSLLWTRRGESDDYVTLEGLKSKLKSNNNNNCLNVVKYSNAVFDCVLYAVVKEGVKLFKAVVDLLANRCGGGGGVNSRSRIRVNEVLAIRLKLFMFQSLLDESFLASRKLTAMPANKTERLRLEIFRLDLTAALRALQMPRDGTSGEFLNAVCSEKLLWLHMKSDKRAHRGEKPDDNRFEGYYLDGPVLNSYALMTNGHALFYNYYY